MHTSTASVRIPVMRTAMPSHSPALCLGRHASLPVPSSRRFFATQPTARSATVRASDQLDLSELTALGPLDGRYASKTVSLRPFFSEYASSLFFGCLAFVSSFVALHLTPVEYLSTCLALAFYSSDSNIPLKTIGMASFVIVSLSSAVGCST